MAAKKAGRVFGLALRWGLTAALLYGVYTETGPFTALTLALVTVTIELLNYRISLHRSW